MINHEPFDWGVRLTAHPFSSGDNQNLTIQADIGFYKHNRGSNIRITFPGVSVAAPLRLGDAQVWYEAMHALVNEIRAVVAQMKADSTKKTMKKKR